MIEGCEKENIDRKKVNSLYQPFSHNSVKMADKDRDKNRARKIN